MNKHCETCRFWEGDPGDSIGDCRRYAPQPVSVEDSSGVRAWWLATNRHDWCGDYDRKDD